MGSNPNLGEKSLNHKKVRAREKKIKMPEKKEEKPEKTTVKEGSEVKAEAVAKTPESKNGAAKEASEVKEEVVKKAEETPKEAAKEAPEVKKEVKSEESDIRHRVRVAGVILDGNKEITQAITNIKGIGVRISRIITTKLGYKKGQKLGLLSEKEIEKLEESINQSKKLTPEWMQNRQREYSTGESNHLIGPDLDMSHREDLTRQKRIRSYKGIRHALNLPVRGQRTRSSFRKGSTLGVVRKKIQPAKKG